MGRTENMKRKKKPRCLLIASYGHMYAKESIADIRSKITKIKPDKIIILKMVKCQPASEMVDATIGLGDMEILQKELALSRKNHADVIAAELIEDIKEFAIPYEVHMRIVEDMSNGIVEEWNKENIVQVIIHKPVKSNLERLMEPCVAERVRRYIPPEKLTMLD